jgi:sterol desaturase/sphingolipid hydroxylase (fatty acid hydroxylase superfamily)
MQAPTETVRPIRLIRHVHLPLLLVGANGAVIWAAANGRDLLVVTVLLAAVAWTFLAERAAPYDSSWNRDHGDTKRDFAYAAMNETLNAASVAALPLLAGLVTIADLWPTSWPFVVQVIVAVLVLDAGITLAHMASHHFRWLWRFHAVHHSVTRFYGLNGLMKHPIHQAIEMTAGVAPLLVIGLPQSVAIAVAGCVVIQLLIQHANIDYTSGPLSRWLAVNTGHRLHHLRYAGQGDVNFGLFTLVWDRLLGTYTPADPERPITTDDVGINGRPDYPTGFADQLAEPFRPTPAVSTA